MTDLTLWEQWVTHRDAGAFQQIIVRHADMVFATCCRILRNASEAEDVAQECFQRLAETKTGPTQHLAAWLHRVATNLSLNRRKADSRRRERETIFAAELAADVSVEWNEVYRLVDETLLELPESLRAPILAHFFERQTHEAIAEATAVSRQTVTYRIGKGIDALRGKLERKGVGIAAAALAAGLGAHTAEATPSTLGARLSKIALSGAPRAGGPGASVAMGGPTLVGSLAFKVLGALIACGLVAGLAVNVFRAREPADVSRTAKPAPLPQAAAIEPTPARGPEAAAPAIDKGETPAVAPEAPSVQGTVRLPDGGPAVGARVELLRAFVSMDSMDHFPSINSFTAIFNEPNVVASAVTDVNGGFAVGKLPSGEKLLCVIRRPGCAIGGGFVAKLGPDEHRTVTFDLLEPTEIQGQVVNEAGAPVKRARVRLWGFYPEPKTSPYIREGGVHGELYGGVAETQAGDDGRFNVGGIPRGWWVQGVSAEAAGYAPSFAWDDKSSAGFNGSVETPLIRPPAPPLKITLQPALTVSGKVTFADGRPADHARVQLYGGLPSRPRVGLLAGQDSEPRIPIESTARYHAETFADANGFYELRGVHPTTFQLDATLGDTASEFLHFVPQSSRKMSGVDFMLQPMGSFSGTVVSADTGRPLAAPLVATLTGAEGGAGGGYLHSDAAGHFNFDKRRAGIWWLSVENANDTITETSFGDLESGHVCFELTPGQRITNLHVAVGRSMASQTGTITGVVYDAANRPVANAEVVVAEGRTATTDEHGAFKLERVRAGAFTVSAVDARAHVYGNAETTVTAGQQSDIELRLTEPAASAAGAIRTRDGKPYDKPVNLRLWLETGQQKVIAAKDGSYETGPLIPGRHEIHVDTHGLVVTPRNYRGKIEAGSRLDNLDFIVEPMTGEVSGTVTYPDGRPAQAMWLLLVGANTYKQGATDDRGAFAFSGVGGEGLELTVGNVPDANGPGDKIWTHLSRLTGDSRNLTIALKPLGKMVGEITVQDDSVYPLEAGIVGANGFSTYVRMLNTKLEVSLQPDTYHISFMGHYQGPEVSDVIIRDLVVESGKVTDIGVVDLRPTGK